MSRELMQQAFDAIRSLMNGREFAVGQTGHYLNIISRIEAELSIPQTEQQFYPDWDMLKPYHDRISELEAELAKPEQEPVAWKYDWYGYKSQSETKELVKDWIASVYSEVSDPTIGAHNIRPLYTAPPRKPWQGLTDDELDHIQMCRRNFWVDAAKIEQLLRDKNT